MASSVPYGRSKAISASLRCLTEGAKPSRRNAVAACGRRDRRNAAAMLRRQMRRRRNVAGRRHRRRHRLVRARVIEAENQHRRLGLRTRQHLDRHLGHGGERPERAGQQLAEIVAGDVLHHAAARLEGLGAARHRREAEEMVARGAGLDPPRPRKVRRERAAERARVRGPAEDRAVIHRLEGELLALALDQRLDLGERRAGPGREHQLLRLVQRHAARARTDRASDRTGSGGRARACCRAPRLRASCPRTTPSARRLRRPWRPGLSARRSC